MRSLVVVLLVLGLSVGCSGEEGVVDDGSQAAVVDTAGLAEAGVEVLSPDVPASADRAAVVAAVAEVGLPEPEAESGLEEVEPPVAGLLHRVQLDGDHLVLVFDDPASAAVFAAGGRLLLPGADQVLLAGNLVGYGADEGAATQVRKVLAMVGDPSA